MLHIIGLSHKAQVRKQHSSETDAQKAFAECLRNDIRETRPDFIAEEYSEESLIEQLVDSIAKEIALENGIVHKFCDPNSKERRDIGYWDYVSIFLDLRSSRDDENLPEQELHLKARAIEIGRYFPAREQFWLDRLNECPGHDGIFICGDAHIEGFTRLLDTNQLRWSIVARGIGISLEEETDIRQDFQYLREHPELAI